MPAKKETSFVVLDQVGWQLLCFSSATNIKKKVLDTIAWCNLWLFPKDFYSALREVRFRVQNLTRRCHIHPLILKLFSMLYGFDWLTHPRCSWCIHRGFTPADFFRIFTLSTQSKSLLDSQTVECFTFYQTLLFHKPLLFLYLFWLSLNSLDNLCCAKIVMQYFLCKNLNSPICLL